VTWAPDVIRFFLLVHDLRRKPLVTWGRFDWHKWRRPPLFGEGGHRHSLCTSLSRDFCFFLRPYAPRVPRSSSTISILEGFRWPL